MSDSDAQIREAVRNHDNELTFALQDEASFMEVIVQSFRGRRRWLSIFPFIQSLIYTGLMFWCGYEFFGAETTKHQIAWASGFLVCAIAVGLIKIWIWGEWQRNSLAREIKRLEIAVVDLGRRVGSK